LARRTPAQEELPEISIQCSNDYPFGDEGREKPARTVRDRIGRKKYAGGFEEKREGEPGRVPCAGINLLIFAGNVEFTGES
jgi:hypothetical protein